MATNAPWAKHAKVRRDFWMALCSLLETADKTMSLLHLFCAGIETTPSCAIPGAR